MCMCTFQTQLCQHALKMAAKEAKVWGCKNLSKVPTERLHYIHRQVDGCQCNDCYLLCLCVTVCVGGSGLGGSKELLSQALQLLSQALSFLSIASSTNTVDTVYQLQFCFNTRFCVVAWLHMCKDHFMMDVQLGWYRLLQGVLYQQGRNYLLTRYCPVL